MTAIWVYGSILLFQAGQLEIQNDKDPETRNLQPVNHVLMHTCGLDLSEDYAQSAWPRVHRDTRNSDYAPIAATAVNRTRWTALDGAAVLAHPSIGPEGHIYVTTGKGPGFAHLHAFDRDGNLLWESQAQSTPESLDSAAVFSVPLVDASGDVYLSDMNQFWAFQSDGSVKWVSPLPAPEGFMASAILSLDGHVGGITIHGKVVFLHRDDGSLAFPVFHLPEGLGPSGPPLPTGLWANGLIDPAIRELVYQATFGYELQVTNTPAMDPNTGRIFITAAGVSPEDGLLYGLDTVDGQFQIAFSTPMTGGSGTSPSLAPDGATVYAVGGDGVLVAVDSETGGMGWRAEGAGAAAAPAIGPDGTIYSGGGEHLLGIRPTDGSIKWKVNFDELAASLLPAIRFSPWLASPRPRSRTNGVVSVTADHVWIPLVLGYEINLPGSAETLVTAQVAALAALSPDDGALVYASPVRDSCEATIAINSDGTILVRHGAMLSSIQYHQLNPLLPDRLDIAGPPLAGLTVLEPVSFAQLAWSGTRWADRLAGQAVAQVNAGLISEARINLCHATTQLHATVETLHAQSRQELRTESVDEFVDLLQTAADSFAVARATLDSEPTAALKSISEGRSSVQEVLRSSIEAYVITIDVQPGRMPRRLSTRPTFRERVRVAIVGAPRTTPVNLASLRLSRADNVAGAVQPVQRRGEPAVRVEDVSAPDAFLGCGAKYRPPDGVDDIVLEFSAREVVETLELESFGEGYRIPVRLTGLLMDGTEFVALDCLTMGGSRK